MKPLESRFGLLRRPIIVVLELCLLVVAGFLLLQQVQSVASQPLQAGQTCDAPFYSISPALNDLGPAPYIRPTTGPTGHIGGLYPGGSNNRPPAHEAAGVAIAQEIQPLNGAGNPDPVNGKIGFVSIGMSNTEQEFDAFLELLESEPGLNSKVVVINGSRGSLASSRWADPNDAAWDSLEEYVEDAGLTMQQIQVVWVKLAQLGAGDFPEKAQALQADLEDVAQNLHDQYPNVRLAYHSSRTRAYAYWEGLSPEPTAFETAFAVRWMIEKQLNGDLSLNYDPANGPVNAPYLSWGPYIWIDGLNPRLDGLTWPQERLEEDCIHPSDSGEFQVAQQLMTFFKTDTTTAPWFLGDGGGGPTPTPVHTATPGPSPTPGGSPTATPQPGATRTPGPSPTPGILGLDHYLPIMQSATQR